MILSTETDKSHKVVTDQYICPTRAELCRALPREWFFRQVPSQASQHSDALRPYVTYEATTEPPFDTTESASVRRQKPVGRCVDVAMCMGIDKTMVRGRKAFGSNSYRN